MKYRGPSCLTCSPTDLAYIAGLMDGEGTIGVYWKPTSGTKGQWHSRAKIANTYAPIMTKLVELTGMGMVHVVQPKAVRKNSNDRISPLYTWTVDSPRSEIVLAALLPYLVIKREQALLAIEAMRIRRTAVRPRTGAIGAKSISPETHNKIAVIRKEIQGLNGNRNAHLAKWPVANGA